jgi:hypothetical protein
MAAGDAPEATGVLVGSVPSVNTEIILFKGSIQKKIKIKKTHAQFRSDHDFVYSTTNVSPHTSILMSLLKIIRSVAAITIS